MASKKSASGRAGRLKYKVVATVLVFLILYVGIQVISRTEGVRATVADKISNGTGLPVSLNKCAATPFLGLQLKGLTFPGVDAPDVRMSFDFFCFLPKDRPVIKKLIFKDMAVRFRRLKNSGIWEPPVLHGVGDRLGAVMGLDNIQPEDTALPKFPPYVINAKTLLQLENAKIDWIDEEGKELASISGGDFRMKIGRFVDRKAVQTIVECNNVELASGRSLNDFRLEAFCVVGSSLVTVLEMSDREGQYPEFASQTLWQDLNEQLNSLSAIR